MPTMMCAWTVAAAGMFLASVSHGQRSVADGQALMAERAAEALLRRPVTLDLRGVSVRRAVDAAAVRANVSVQYRTRLLEAYRGPVTLRVREIPLGVVLQQLLSGTSLRIVPDGATQLMIVEKTEMARALDGVITGSVFDASSKRPLRGATVFLDDATQGVRTAEDGSFHVTGLAAGSHRVRVRLMGYTGQSRVAEVSDGDAVAVRFELMQSANTLDQVIVTGTVVPTERKAIPNAMTVITAKQIEERGITRIDQLFRGDVPGMFSLNRGSGSFFDGVTMFSRGATALGAGAGTSLGTNAIKTYVDGVEVSDPQYFSQINPKSIERIEILTGPQASTVYGSNALNGVMQIFTKRGTSSAPQLTLNVLSGWIENEYSGARAPQHDHAAQVTGAEGRTSYSAGASWAYEGPWTPAQKSVRTGVFGGARIALPTSVGNVTTDVTYRRAYTRTRSAAESRQVATEGQQSGLYAVYEGSSTGGHTSPSLYTLTGETAGITMTYAPLAWWSHELGLGRDVTDIEVRSTARGYQAPHDTALRLSLDRTEKRSLRYTTTARLPLTHLAQMTVTVGADATQRLAMGSQLFGYGLTGTVSNNASVDVTRQPGHNSGSFVQAQIGLFDQLFVTYGLRAEWNPDFGAEAQPNYAPRYGIAYTKNVGTVTAKLRASYGKSTRPPLVGMKLATRVDPNDFLVSIYGQFNDQLANSDLGPEHQSGGEGGLELYFGTRASLVITRYNQTVSNLIARVPGIDSVRSLAPDPTFFGMTCTEVRSFGFTGWCANQDADGYAYAWVTQHRNVAGIRNQGWELQGQTSAGPLTIGGTYSWTKSRSLCVTPEFQNNFASLIQYAPQYRRGATFELLPEHSWAFSVTYAQSRTRVGLTVTGSGQARMGDDALSARHLAGDIRLLQDRWIVIDGPGVILLSPGYAMADVTAAQRFLPWVEGILEVRNLTAKYRNDMTPYNASIGRQGKVGAKIRL
jgi:outer membrane cobalamin receptor